MTENLPCKMEPHELLQAGEDLARVVQDIAMEEYRQADQRATMKARLQGLEARRTVLATMVARKEEWRDVEVREEPDYTAGVVKTVRLDTMETTAERKMRDDERQQPLPTTEG